MPAFEFRRIGTADHDYCWSLYRDCMQPLALELAVWNEARQHRAVEEALREEGASILMNQDSDLGWLHVVETRYDIHLGHLYLAPERRGQGLGTGFLGWMGERARRKGKQLSLDLMRNSPARRLGERLGYRVSRTAGVMLKMELGA